MTRTGIIYGVLVIGVLAAAGAGLYLAALLLPVLILLPMMSLLYCLYIRQGLTVTVSECVSVSDKHRDIPVVLAIRNRQRLPAVRLDVRVRMQNMFFQRVSQRSVLTAVGGRKVKKLRFSINSEFCGKMSFSADEIRICDPFSLFALRYKTGLMVFTAVLPDINPVDMDYINSPVERVEGESFSLYKSGDDPSEIFDIRDYAHGDKYRRIHWKLSIKQDRLMVKEYSRPLDDSLTLLVDLCMQKESEDPEAVDAVLEEAMSLCCDLLGRGVLHRLCWYDNNRDTLVTQRITRENDLYEALGQLLGISVYHGQPLGLLSLDPMHQQLTHVYVFIPELQLDGTDTLLAVSDRVSIVYARSADGDVFENTYSGMLYPVAPRQEGTVSV